MRIERLSYADQAGNWWLSGAEFFPDVTMLVGGSDVDRSLVLDALENLARFALGQTPDEMWGTEWDLTFATEAGQYRWQGRLSGKRASLQEGMRTKSFLKFFLPEALRRGLQPVVLCESLTLDGRKVVDREAGLVRVHGRNTDGHSPSRSILTLLRAEGDVRAAAAGFLRVVSTANAGEALPNLGMPLGDLCAAFPDLESIRESNLPTYAKLALVHENAPDVFRAIVASFGRLFPEVEDVGIDRVNQGRFTDVAALRILDKVTQKWLPESKISSEMLQALLSVSSVLLWPKDAVVLADDFESGLGVPFLEHVLESVNDESRGLQYIATSRNPAVIHRVGAAHCQALTWEGAVVRTHAATQQDLGKPRSTGIVTTTSVAGQALPRVGDVSDIINEPGTPGNASAGK